VLGHFIEEAGVPTAGISLIRPHTEIIKPPRALWVPFELGRPLGPPNNPEFQKKVLLALLRLLEAPTGPVLEDFPEDEPESDEIVVLACPVNFARDVGESGDDDKILAAFRQEITAMRPWYDMAVNKRQRTTVGVSGINLDKLGDFIYAFIKGETPEKPQDDVPLLNTLKFAVEDLKSYYIEGITAQPGQANASSQRLQDWFWGETVGGKVLLALKKVLEASPDKMTQMMGAHFIVPHEVARRQGEK
jgi:hypothetical protein